MHAKFNITPEYYDITRRFKYRNYVLLFISFENFHYFLNLKSFLLLIKIEKNEVLYSPFVCMAKLHKTIIFFSSNHHKKNGNILFHNCHTFFSLELNFKSKIHAIYICLTELVLPKKQQTANGIYYILFDVLHRYSNDGNSNEAAKVEDDERRKKMQKELYVKEKFVRK